MTSQGEETEDELPPTEAALEPPEPEEVIPAAPDAETVATEIPPETVRPRSSEATEVGVKLAAAAAELLAPPPPAQAEPAPPTPPPPPFRLSRAHRGLVALTVIGPPLLGALLLVAGVPGRILDRLRQGDWSEPNERLAEGRRVAPGRSSGLQCRPGDVDWFAFEVPDGQAMRLTTSEVEGEGELSVHDPRTGGLLARAALGSGEAPLLSWLPPAGGGTAAVRVVGDLSYALELELVEPGARFERPGLQPALLPAGEHPEIRLEGEDHYLVERLPLRPLRVTLSGAAGLKLVSKEARIDPTGRVAELPARATRGRTGLHVAGGLRGLVYALKVEHLAPADAAGPAAGAPPVAVSRGRREPNDEPEGAPTLEAGLHLGLACDGVDHYWFTAPADGTLEALILPGDGRDREALEWLALELVSDAGAGGSSRAGWGAPTSLPMKAGERARVSVQGGYRPRGAAPVAYGLRLDLRPPPGPAQPLVAGTHTRLCSGSDAFEVALAQGETARLTLSWDAARGRLALRLGRHGRVHEIEDDGFGDGGREETVLAEYTAFRPETLEVVVEGDRIPYDLALEVAAAPQGGGSSLPPEKVPASGRSIRFLRVAAGQSLAIDLRGQDPRQDVDMYLQDENGSQLASANSSRHVESLRWVAQADGTIAVCVQGPVGAVFQLSVEVRDPLPTGTVAPLLEPGNYLDQVCAGAVDRTLVLRQGSRLEVVASPSSPDLGAVRLVLVDPTGIEVAASEGEPPELLFVADQEGAHTLRIEGPPGGETRFDMLVTVDDR